MLGTGMFELLTGSRGFEPWVRQLLRIIHRVLGAALMILSIAQVRVYQSICDVSCLAVIVVMSVCDV